MMRSGSRQEEEVRACLESCSPLEQVGGVLGNDILPGGGLTWAPNVCPYKPARSGVCQVVIGTHV